MSSTDEKCKAKIPYDELLEEGEERKSKINRQDVDIATAEVDRRLADKLDSLLNISDQRKPKFLTNKPKQHDSSNLGGAPSVLNIQSDSKLKQRHLTHEELRERVAKKYDALVPEYNSNGKNVRMVKILTTSESIELGKDQARKQMERQLELNSVSGNRLVQIDGCKAFRFIDGYEMSTACSSLGVGNKSRLPSKINSKLCERKRDPERQTTKRVQFTELKTDEDCESNDDEDDEDDDLTESD